MSTTAISVVGNLVGHDDAHRGGDDPPGARNLRYLSSGAGAYHRLCMANPMVVPISSCRATAIDGKLWDPAQLSLAAAESLVLVIR